MSREPERSAGGRRGRIMVGGGCGNEGIGRGARIGASGGGAGRLGVGGGREAARCRGRRRLLGGGGAMPLRAGSGCRSDPATKQRAAAAWRATISPPCWSPHSPGWAAAFSTSWPRRAGRLAAGADVTRAARDRRECHQPHPHPARQPHRHGRHGASGPLGSRLALSEQARRWIVGLLVVVIVGELVQLSLRYVLELI